MFVVVVHNGGLVKGPFPSQAEAIEWAKKATTHQIIYGRWDVRPIDTPVSWGPC